MAVVSTRALGFIDPKCLYTRRGAMAAAAICEAKWREAKRHGIECRRFWVGKKCYISGRDLIQFLEELSADEVRRSCSVEAEAE